MRVGDNENQLYISSLLEILRKYQRQAILPDFNKFIAEVKSICKLTAQKGPLEQRIALLESVIAESKVNDNIVEESLDLTECRRKGFLLVITDLTDPLLSKTEANSLFQVLAEQFRALKVDGGKLLVIDEAHKFMSGVSSDGLSEAIVHIARMMRHDGMRLLISTQNPKALAPELLELVSIAVLHHFHSRDWWDYLKCKLPLPEKAWNEVLSLSQGDGLLFASRHHIPSLQKNSADNKTFRIHVRPRFTVDCGASKANN